jgi:hypothetical protein
MPNKEQSIDLILEAVNKLVHTACDPDTTLDSDEVMTEYNELCGILDQLIDDPPSPDQCSG